MDMYFPCKLYSWYILCVGDMYRSIYVVYALHIIIFYIYIYIYIYILYIYVYIIYIIYIYYSLHCWNTLRNDKIKSKPRDQIASPELQAYHAGTVNTGTASTKVMYGHVDVLLTSMRTTNNDDRVRNAVRSTWISQVHRRTHSLWLSNIAMNNGIFIWLVVSTPLKNINMSLPVGMMTFPTVQLNGKS